MAGFDGIPGTSNASMSYVVGQNDFVSTAPGRSDAAVAMPQQLLVHNDLYYLLEYDNARMLVFDSAPWLAPRTASAVLGQPDFTTKDTSCTVLNFDRPETMMIADGKLFIADSHHNRVLIWNTVPTATGTPPDLVLGQSDFTLCGNNDDDQANFADNRPNTSILPGGVIAPPTASTLRYAWDGIWSNGRQLLLSDSSNNRVLMWNEFPTENFELADVGWDNRISPTPPRMMTIRMEARIPHQHAR